MEAQDYKNPWFAHLRTSSSTGEYIRGRRAHTFTIDEYPVYNFTAYDLATGASIFGGIDLCDRGETPTIEISEAEFIEVITKYDRI